MYHPAFLHSLKHVIVTLALLPSALQRACLHHQTSSHTPSISHHTTHSYKSSTADSNVIFCYCTTACARAYSPSTTTSAHTCPPFRTTPQRTHTTHSYKSTTAGSRVIFYLLHCTTCTYLQYKCITPPAHTCPLLCTALRTALLHVCRMLSSALCTTAPLFRHALLTSHGVLAVSAPQLHHLL